MMVSLATSVIEIKHTVDPKKVIWDKMQGWLDKITPTAGDAVICVYERPETTKGNIIIPETASRRAEDAFQGTVGLIVKVGPDFGKHGPALGLQPMPKVGDWVAFRSVDCVPFTLGKSPMRLLQGNFIRMVLTDPDAII